VVHPEDVARMDYARAALSAPPASEPMPAPKAPMCPQCGHGTDEADPCICHSLCPGCRHQKHNQGDCVRCPCEWQMGIRTWS
jgi:hypothetical protein